MQDENSLEARLKNRRYMPPGMDLAERIAHAAKTVPQQRTAPLPGWLQPLMGNFLLPHQAASLSLALLFGLAVGFGLPAQPKTPPTPSLLTFLDDGVMP